MGDGQAAVLLPGLVLWHDRVICPDDLEGFDGRHRIRVTNRCGPFRVNGASISQGRLAFPDKLPTTPLTTEVCTRPASTGSAARTWWDGREDFSPTSASSPSSRTSIQSSSVWCCCAWAFTF